MDDKVIVRKANGQFGPGNQTGGRKRRAEEDAVKALFLRAISTKDQVAIIQKARDQALRGDKDARRFIFDYLHGPPIQRNEHTGESGGAVVIKVIYEDGDAKGS